MWVDIQSYIDAHNELDLSHRLEQLHQGMESADRYFRVKSASEGDFFAPTKGHLVEVQDYAHWRGRTLRNSSIFLDEAQNLSPMEFRHLMQRIGLGSLVIISGDYEQQIDNPRMHETSNGLFQGLRHYLNLERPYVAVINLPGSYRDWGAEDASSMVAYR
jgi:predicted ribonuclease YlaK